MLLGLLGKALLVCLCSDSVWGMELALLLQTRHRGCAAQPGGLHRQDVAGKGVLVVINNLLLGNEKCTCSQIDILQKE